MLLQYSDINETTITIICKVADDKPNYFCLSITSCQGKLFRDQYAKHYKPTLFRKD